MALHITTHKRVFKFKGNSLSDPDPSMSPLEVQKFYSGTYPELTTATVQGPSMVDEVAVYEFKTSVGTKG